MKTRSGLTYLGNSPELDERFKKVVEDLRSQARKGELKPHPGADETASDQEQQLQSDSRHQASIQKPRGGFRQ